MAHMIESDKEFAYAGMAEGKETVRPWHGLGKRVPGLMTVAEALHMGGLDFDVELRKLYANDGTEETSIPAIPVEGNFATVRKDNNKILGVVGSRYRPVQNVAALNFFDSAIGEGAAAIETVGALEGGKRIFMMARIPEMVEIVPGDPIERFLLFTNSHDGRSGVECLFTPIRVVCNNTLTASLSNSEKENEVRSKKGLDPCRVSVRHTRKAEERLALAKDILASEGSYWQRVQGAFRYMAKNDVTRQQVEAFVADLFPSEVDEEGKISTRSANIREKVIRAFESSPGAQSAGSTAWGLYNAATFYLDHEYGSDKKTPGQRFESSLFGQTGPKIRQKAFDLAMAL